MFLRTFQNFHLYIYMHRNVKTLDGRLKKYTALHLSLSRLNHRQPRIQAHPEIVQGATDLHHHITNTFFPQTHAVFDDTTALDTAVDMLDPQPPLVEHLIGQVLLQGELCTAGLLRRHKDLYLREREGQ